MNKGLAAWWNDFDDTQKTCGLFLGSIVLSLVVWTAYGLLKHENHSGKVAIVSWHREIHIETFKTVHYENVGYLKSNSRNVKSWDDGMYVNDYDSNGNWTGGHWEEDIRYSYDHDEWVHLRDVIDEANNGKPVWPAYKLATGPLKRSNRVSGRTEVYTVYLDMDEFAEQWKYNELTELQWNQYRVGDDVIVMTNGFGYIQGIKVSDVSGTN